MRLGTKASFLFFAIVLSLAVSGDASDEQVLHDVSGVVVDQSVSPVGGARVELMNATSGELVQSSRATAEGYFTVSLRAGTYVVRVIPDSNHFGKVQIFFRINPPALPFLMIITVIDSCIFGHKL